MPVAPLHINLDLNKTNFNKKYLLVSTYINPYVQAIPLSIFYVLV